MKKTLFIGTILVAGVVACSKSSDNDNGTTPPNTDCSNVSAKFAADISPIIQGSCATSGCHGAGSGNGPGPLTTYTQIKNAAASIKSAVVARSMPKTGSLSSTQIQQISCWVDNGAQNN